jgi:hypothetical protein
MPSCKCDREGSKESGKDGSIDVREDPSNQFGLVCLATRDSPQNCSLAINALSPFTEVFVNSPISARPLTLLNPHLLRPLQLPHLESRPNSLQQLCYPRVKRLSRSHHGRRAEENREGVMSPPRSCKGRLDLKDTNLSLYELTGAERAHRIPTPRHQSNPGRRVRHLSMESPDDGPRRLSLCREHAPPHSPPLPNPSPTCIRPSDLLFSPRRPPTKRYQTHFRAANSPYSSSSPRNIPSARPP